MLVYDDCFGRDLMVWHSVDSCDPLIWPLMEVVLGWPAMRKPPYLDDSDTASWHVAELIVIHVVIVD
jgi:hypothetical protein